MKDTRPPTRYRLPPDLVAAITAAARRDGQSVTAWVVESLLSRLRAEVPDLAPDVTLRPRGRPRRDVA